MWRRWRRGLSCELPAVDGSAGAELVSDNQRQDSRSFFELFFAFSPDKSFIHQNMKPIPSLIALALGFSVGVLPLAAENDGCKPVAGPFTSTIVGAGCESPVGICTLGILKGNFHATYQFTMLTLAPMDPSNPAILAYTGVSVITLRSGEQLFAVDTGVMDTTDPTAAPFQTTATISGGTGKYTSGQIIATGTLNLITGEAVGSHSGEICKDK